MFMGTLQLGGLRKIGVAISTRLALDCSRALGTHAAYGWPLNLESWEWTMSEANIATVQNLYAAFGRGDIDTIANGCLPDVFWASGGRKEDYPPFGPRKGIEAVRDFFRSVAEVQTFDEFSPREFYADRDRVFVLGRYAMTVKKNGRKVASEWVHIFTFRGGKVSDFREFTDTAAFAAAYRG
jgi:ketosteroid isomerase-like protein